MPFLHGFRRIVYDYQALVDSIMCCVGHGTHRAPLLHSLEEVLMHMSQSEVFEEGISCALFKLAELGEVSSAEILLRYGANFHFEDPVSYYNPLHIAVLRNKPDMVKLLLEHGADIERRDRVHESSPLDLASEESERLPCLTTLLEMGADVNKSDRRGKSPLLHALASADGLTVLNTDSIEVLLKRGADVNAATVEGERVVSQLVFLVKEALGSSARDAAEIGQFCLKTTELLLSHGLVPSYCVAEDEEPSLTDTSLQYFDLLFPLGALLIDCRASWICASHGASCWTGYGMFFQRLKTALQQSPDRSHASEVLEKAEALLDLARMDLAPFYLPPRLELPVPGQDPHPYAQALVDLHNRVLAREASPPSLQCLCRASIRNHLQPWPLEQKVKALPLPDQLKDFLLPGKIYTARPGWGCFKPLANQN